MCLITIAWKRLPTIKEMTLAHEDNKDGMGFAFREKDQIRFVKGMHDPEEARKIMEKVPLPLVIHYRWASMGGKEDALCHPFPLVNDVNLNLVGKAPAVLFHNGHYTAWADILRNLAISRNEEIPAGPWSDTRAISWVVTRLGHTILNTIDGKYVFFSKDTCMMYGAGWSEEKEGDKVVMWHSNRSWEKTGYVYHHQPNFPPTSARSPDPWSPESWKSREPYKSMTKEERKAKRREYLKNEAERATCPLHELSDDAFGDHMQHM